MPNWCITDYTLVGSEKDVQKAYDALHKVEETPRPDDHDPWSFLSNPCWLGYIVEDIFKQTYDSVDCRGTFYGLSTSTWGDKSSVVFSTETAWSPCMEMMEKLAEMFHLSLNFYSQEHGSIYYVRQSPDGVYNDTLYYNSEEEGEEFYETLADFLREQGSKYGLTETSTLQEALAAVNATKDDMLEEITDLSKES